MNTEAPAAANDRAVARPMPEVPPVTPAVRALIDHLAATFPK
ncbi:hypothetical protein [Novosphingobium sp. 1529]|nr:hypothetical protein [Novosphingobium sp. BK256]MBB3419572.1 hypothetical protein [Novosphingobium sp. BK267]MBB3475936.1 hypothetical protein [Novosphingobium sp. BK369]MBB3500054.1 hypothetical protein [Novosphingobium sp. BK336]MBB3535838.1 hypothetical protein [Novosphingobium sp. BK486]MBB3619833.1 hypothetical protein [Novosphingobium sp. BK592]MBB3651286.1 hypothetical protein [Novosphingobium sp. BK626]NOX03564.1 hypothetical protein [Novosphingobium sp. SG754]